MTNELSNVQQRALADCLRALDAGDSVEAALARHAESAHALRPLLELRARLLSAELPAPHPAAYQAGRQALLDRLAAPRPAVVETAAWPFAALLQRWRAIGSPAVRFAAIVAAVGVLGLGALGASAAGGAGPGRDVLSALRIVPDEDNDASPDGAGVVDGTPQPTALAPDDAGQPQEVPGVGLCFDGDRTPPPGLSDDVLEHVPGAGLCVPEGLVEHQPDGRACLPTGLIDRFPELGDVAGDDAVCGNHDGTPSPGSDDNGPADHPNGPPEDAGPPDDVPAPTDVPHGPPDGAGEPQNQEQEAHPTPPVQLPEQSQ